LQDEIRKLHQKLDQKIVGWESKLSERLLRLELKCSARAKPDTEDYIAEQNDILDTVPPQSRKRLRFEQDEMAFLTDRWWKSPEEFGLSHEARLQKFKQKSETKPPLACTVENIQAIYTWYLRGNGSIPPIRLVEEWAKETGDYSFRRFLNSAHPDYNKNATLGINAIKTYRRLIDLARHVEDERCRLAAELHRAGVSSDDNVCLREAIEEIIRRVKRKEHEGIQFNSIAQYVDRIAKNKHK